MNPEGGARKMYRANGHHLLWTRRNWRKGYAGKLRSYWYLKAKIPADTLHRHIHENMVGIPRPHEAICQQALEQLKELARREVIHSDDSIQNRLKLLIFILDTGDSPTANALREQLRLIENYTPPD